MSDKALSVTIPTIELPTIVFSAAQLGYCDSDVTVFLLFWTMPIVQIREAGYLVNNIYIFTNTKSK